MFTSDVLGSFIPTAAVPSCPGQFVSLLVTFFGHDLISVIAVPMKQKVELAQRPNVPPLDAFFSEYSL